MFALALRAPANTALQIVSSILCRQIYALIESRSQGVRFNVSTAVDVTLDYDNLGTVGKYARGQDVKADMLSLGLRYKF